jgi:hypothetical protein
MALAPSMNALAKPVKSAATGTANPQWQTIMARIKTKTNRAHCSNGLNQEADDVVWRGESRPNSKKTL